MKEINLKEFGNIFNKIKFKNEDINLLKKYLKAIDYTEDDLKLYIEKFMKNHFGCYFMLKDESLITIDEERFLNFIT